MEWMEFISDLTQAIAWPAVVLVLGFSSREFLSRLAQGNVKHLKAGPSGLEMSFWDREVVEAREALAQQLPEPGDRPPLSYLYADPPGMVVTAFGRIEAKLRELVVDQGVLSPEEASSIGSRRLTNIALNAGLLSPESATAVEGLAVLRNLAAHGEAENLDGARAADFVAMTEAVLFALDNKP